MDNILKTADESEFLRKFQKVSDEFLLVVKEVENQPWVSDRSKKLIEEFKKRLADIGNKLLLLEINND